MLLTNVLNGFQLTRANKLSVPYMVGGTSSVEIEE